VLRRILVVAKKRGPLDMVKEIEWLRAPKPDFDLLDFDEADRLVNAADGEWRWMILMALRTGLRQGELLALRWDASVFSAA
jgi:integrase